MKAVRIKYWEINAKGEKVENITGKIRKADLPKWEWLIADRGGKVVDTDEEW